MMRDIRENLERIGVSEDYIRFGATLRLNAFNKNGYIVNSFGGLRRFKLFLSDYTEVEDLKEATPAFQRDNDKWSLIKKQKFILNVLKGLDSTITLMTLNDSSRHYILDGLQRVTAIYEFLNGEFPLENGLYFSSILKNNLDKVSAFKVYLKVYSFDNEIEAINFYVDINEGITHSEEDITRAKKRLRELRGE